MEFIEAISKASRIRFRPILMTALTTVIGSLPLVFSHGAGAESRFVLGTVICFGVTIMTFLTLYLIPITYGWLAKNTQLPHAVSQKLEGLLDKYKDKV